MIDIIGWLGTMMLAFCAAPQAWQSYKTKSSKGVNWSFLNMWFFGEILTIIYVIPKGHTPLTMNYILNLLFLIVIMYYKIKEDFNV